MTEWNLGETVARARCRGYDLEARWGSGKEFALASAERKSGSPQAEKPRQDDQGIITRVRSAHRGVDTITMFTMEEGRNRDEALREFTERNSPESLLPVHEDWIDEWSWIAKYRDQVRWQRRGNQATAFLGHLTVTVQMTTMREALERVREAAEPNTLYGANHDLDEEIEGFEDSTPVLIIELREDLRLIASKISKTDDGQAGSIREYTRKTDPAVTATGCLMSVYQ